MRFSILAVLLLVPALARAQAGGEDPRLVKAREYVAAARSLFYEGRYGVAGDSYREAYNLVPENPKSGQLLYNMGLAYRRQFTTDGDPAWLRRSAEAYDQYLLRPGETAFRDEVKRSLREIEQLLASRPGQAEAPSATQLLLTSRTPGASGRIDRGDPVDLPFPATVPPGEHEVVIEAPGFVPQTLTALAVERRLVVVAVELLPMPARLQVSAPPAAHVFVDGVTWGEAPLPGPARVDPGEHIVTITAPGHRAAVRRVQLERGGSLDISVDRLEPTDQRFASRLVLAGAGGAALAAVATGVAAIVQQGRAIDGDPRRQPGATHADLVSFNSYVASRDEFRTASIALATGAGVLGVAGLMLHVLDTPQVPAPPVTVRAFDTAAPAGADPLEAP